MGTTDDGPAGEISLPDSWEQRSPGDAESAVYCCHRVLESGVDVRVEVLEREPDHYLLRLAISEGEQAGHPRTYPVLSNGDRSVVFARTARLCRRIDEGIESGAIAPEQPLESALRLVIRDVSNEGMLAWIRRRLGGGRRA